MKMKTLLFAPLFYFKLEVGCCGVKSTLSISTFTTAAGQSSTTQTGLTQRKLKVKTLRQSEAEMGQTSRYS